MGAACEVAQMQWDSTTALALPSTEVTQLHLFRHGEVDTGGVRRAYGHTDYPLTARGQDQGRSLVDFAQRRLPPADGVISSDLARCTAIARPLAERLGVPLLTSPLLRAQHMGAWEGRAWDALSEADIAFVREYWSHYATVRPPGGETYSEMAFRVTGWLEAEWAQLRGRRWHVLTHIGPIRAFCCRLLGVPLDQALRFTPLYCSHTWFQLAQALFSRRWESGPGPSRWAQRPWLAPRCVRPCLRGAHRGLRCLAVQARARPHWAARWRHASVCPTSPRACGRGSRPGS